MLDGWGSIGGVERQPCDFLFDLSILFFEKGGPVDGTSAPKKPASDEKEPTPARGNLHKGNK